MGSGGGGFIGGGGGVGWAGALKEGSGGVAYESVLTFLKLKCVSIASGSLEVGPS